jgi:hypothetical protein
MEERREQDDQGGIAKALMGAAAGAIGVWALDRVDWFMWNRMDEADRARTRAARPDGEPPAHVVASKLEELAGVELSERAHDAAGDAVHYSLGIAPAVGYALLRDKLPFDGPVRGLAYGLGLFLVQDEALNAASGLGGRPGDYPWQDHARGLVAHLVYGLTTEVALNLMENLSDRTRQDWEREASLPRRQTPEAIQA